MERAWVVVVASVLTGCSVSHFGRAGDVRRDAGQIARALGAYQHALDFENLTAEQRRSVEDRRAATADAAARDALKRARQEFDEGELEASFIRLWQLRDREGAWRAPVVQNTAVDALNVVADARWAEVERERAEKRYLEAVELALNVSAPFTSAHPLRQRTAELLNEAREHHHAIAVDDPERAFLHDRLAALFAGESAPGTPAPFAPPALVFDVGTVEACPWLGELVASEAKPQNPVARVSLTLERCTDDVENTVSAKPCDYEDVIRGPDGTYQREVTKRTCDHHDVSAKSEVSGSAAIAFEGREMTAPVAITVALHDSAYWSPTGQRHFRTRELGQVGAQQHLRQQTARQLDALLRSAAAELLDAHYSQLRESGQAALRDNRHDEAERALIVAYTHIDPTQDSPALLFEWRHGVSPQQLDALLEGEFELAPPQTPPSEEPPRPPYSVFERYDALSPVVSQNESTGLQLLHQTSVGASLSVLASPLRSADYGVAVGASVSVAGMHLRLSGLTHHVGEVAGFEAGLRLLAQLGDLSLGFGLTYVQHNSTAREQYTGLLVPLVAHLEFNRWLSGELELSPNLFDLKRAVDPQPGDPSFFTPLRAALNGNLGERVWIQLGVTHYFGADDGQFAHVDVRTGVRL